MIKTTYIKAFTQDPNRGNPAVVIEGPIDSPEAMEAIQKADCGVAALIDTSKTGPVPIRFFYEFGATETFACGHATLAAAQVLLPEGQGEVKSSFINQKNQTVDVVRKTDGRISQKQSMPEFAASDCTRERAAEALGLNTEDISSELPIELVGLSGKLKLKIPTTKKALISIERNHPKIMKLCKETAATGLFPFAIDLEECDCHARHFPTRDQEDLVCGVGSLAISSYLKKHAWPDKNAFVIRCGPGEQGVGDVIVQIKEDSVLLEGFAC
jgi:PhzF family phenazine biosynthesis protein